VVKEALIPVADIDRLEKAPCPSGVVKFESPDIAHKTKRGAVRLRSRSREPQAGGARRRGAAKRNGTMRASTACSFRKMASGLEVISAL